MEEKRTKLKDIVKSDNCPPLVFLGSIDKWPASRWTVDCLSKILEDRQLRCKIAPLDHQGKALILAFSSVCLIVMKVQSFFNSLQRQFP